MTMILAPPRSENLPSSCCCGCSLKTGVLLIAITSAVYWAVYFYLYSLLLALTPSLTDYIGIPIMLPMAFSMIVSVIGCMVGCLCCGLSSHRFAQIYLGGYSIEGFYVLINSLVYIFNPLGVAEKLCSQVGATPGLDVSEVEIEACTQEVAAAVSSQYWSLGLNVLFRIYFLVIIYAFERQLADTVKTGGLPPAQYQAYVVGGQEAPTVTVVPPGQILQSFPTQNYPAQVAPAGPAQVLHPETQPFIGGVGFQPPAPSHEGLPASVGLDVI